MNKKALTILATFGLLCSIYPASINAESSTNVDNSTSSPTNVFTSVPDQQEIERQKQYEPAPPTAWEVDLNGNKKTVPYIVPSALGNATKGTIGTQSWSDSNYTYAFDGWALSSTQLDDYRFYVSKVSIDNHSSQPLPLKYTQQNSITTQWSVGANISAEAEFGPSFLSSLTVSLGGNWSKSKTSYASTTIEMGPVNVPSGWAASFTKYQGGGYGQGQARWKKYIKGTSSLVGLYYTGESGWAVNDSVTKYVYADHKI
ncbi:hypothetical protein NYE24_12895 [Paenibacillus sp. FSL H7-0350]|uniref:hypothetical protein n=1 Tax=Paenibacillus sp. FSL H7-0350 TaxID=2975345 RepID=UPI0031588DBD